MKIKAYKSKQLTLNSSPMRVDGRRAVREVLVLVVHDQERPVNILLDASIRVVRSV